MRKRRLIRLAGLKTNNLPSSSNGSNCLSSPGTPGPSNDQTAIATSSPLSSVSTEACQTPEAPMETEENGDKGSKSSGIDVDSGIENMEVEESDRKEIASRSRVSNKKKKLIIVYCEIIKNYSFFANCINLSENKELLRNFGAILNWSTAFEILCLV